MLLITKLKNRYFYNSRINKFLLCHPLLYHLLELHSEKVDLCNWVNGLSPKHNKIEYYGYFSKKEIEYYYRKFLMLMRSGYFSTINREYREYRLSGRLTPDTIKRQLANVKQLTFEVTDSCNLRCEYCAYGKFYENYDKRENKNLKVSIAKKFIDYLVEFWNSPYNISHNSSLYIGFYGGEPLINFPFIKEMVEYVKKAIVVHNRFNFAITTNGTLLKKYIEFLVINNFSLLISLDGNEINNEYRVYQNGKPAYKTILKNISALKENYPAYFANRVNFNAVLHNKNSVAGIYKYFKNNFDKVPIIAELNTIGIRDDQKEEFRKKYANVTENLYQSEDYSFIEKDMFINLPSIQRIALFIHKYSGYVFRNYNELFFNNEDQRRLPTGTCLPFSKKVFVTVNGKILPCEKVGHQFALGYVDEKRIELDFEKIAKRYNRYFDKMKKQCSTCFNSEACNQCIFNLNLKNKYPVCNGFMNSTNFLKYLSNYIAYLESNPGVYYKIMREVQIE